MNGFICSRLIFLLTGSLLLVVTLAVSGGCGDQVADKSLQTDLTQSTVDHDQSAIDWVPDRRTAREIVAGVLNRYAFAKTYSDRAVLYLNYRLDGRAIQEPQPWATQWTSTGKFAADFYNSQIRCDGKLLDCYVFDIATANLDNQKLVMPANGHIPLRELYSDPIASHFLNGKAEMPIDKSRSQKLAAIQPPQFWLLADATKVPWLNRPDRLQRLPDARLDDHRCYVIRTNLQNETFDVWIDQPTGLILQIAYPVSMLEPTVRAAAQITELKLVAKFHNAAIDKPLSDENFKLQDRPDATLVRQFVKLPEALPSERIGQGAAKFSLFKPDGTPIKSAQFDRPTVLFWMAGPGSIPAIRQFAELSQKIANVDCEFIVVYSDSELEQLGTGSYLPNEAIRALANETNIKMLYDQNLDASAALKIKAIPCVVVVDDHQSVQFARALNDDKWTEQVAAAVTRVAAGENIAQEMLTEYEKYLDAYHAKLNSVSADDLVGKNSIISNVSGSGEALHRKLQPTRLWSSDQFKRAGNICIVQRPGANQLFVFDGWQTVLELDSAGAVANRFELNFPGSAGASVLRASNTANQYVVFTPLGEQAYLLDENFQLVLTLPKIKHTGLTDIQFDERDPAKTALLFSAKGGAGLGRIEIRNGTETQLSILPVESIDARELLTVSDGQLYEIKADSIEKIDGLADWNFQRIISSPAGDTCGLTRSNDETWYAIGLGPKQNQFWSLSIGSQFFENNIQPMSWTLDKDGKTIWAIADADSGIHLIGGEGKWLGDFQADGELRGFGLMNDAGKLKMIVSTSNSVECWALNSGQRQNENTPATASGN